MSKTFRNRDNDSLETVISSDSHDVYVHINIGELSKQT